MRNPFQYFVPLLNNFFFFVGQYFLAIIKFATQDIAVVTDTRVVGGIVFRLTDHTVVIVARSTVFVGLAYKVIAPLSS